MFDRAQWLAKLSEPALEPALPVIDPHHHLWDMPGSRYLLDELLADTGSGHNVVATVFVECRAMCRSDGPVHLRPVGETEFVNGIAAQSASGMYGPTRACAGIVAHANLALGAAAGEVLDAHMAASSRFRGIRHSTGWDADDAIQNSATNPPKGQMLEAQFRQGANQLVRRGLSFDSWFFHPQLPELADFASKMPDLTIILDHFGGPLGVGPYAGKRDEIFAQWKKDIARLAQYPNVNVKIGGVNMPVSGFGWHRRDTPPTSEELAAATRDYYLHTIDAFGPARCMFESNFPVDKTSCSYGILWNAFKRIAAGFSASDKAALFHGTANRVYRLGL